MRISEWLFLAIHWTYIFIFMYIKNNIYFISNSLHISEQSCPREANQEKAKAYVYAPPHDMGPSPKPKCSFFQGNQNIYVWLFLSIPWREANFDHYYNSKVSMVDLNSQLCDVINLYIKTLKWELLHFEHSLINVIEIQGRLNIF